MQFDCLIERVQGKLYKLGMLCKILFLYDYIDNAYHSLSIDVGRDVVYVNLLTYVI